MLHTHTEDTMLRHIEPIEAAGWWWPIEPAGRLEPLEDSVV